MGISFKVSKTGRRFRPKPIPQVAAGDEEQNDAVTEEPQKKSDPNSTQELVANENKGAAEISDYEISFTLSLFPNGYKIGKPMEIESGRQSSIDVPKFLHPYDRASETLFSAIESGLLPGDILDDIPCKYINGKVACEVLDYRNCLPEAGLNVGTPIINRVCLRMSLENVVKDIPAISENDWTYGDLMEVESRILQALQPELCLDPKPQLERLSENHGLTKLNIDSRSMRRKRLRQLQEVAVSSNDKSRMKKTSVDKAAESSRLGELGSLVQQQPPTYENFNPQNIISSTMPNQSKYQVGVVSPRIMKDQRSGSLLNTSVASPGGHDMLPFTDNNAVSIHANKRENPDVQLSQLTNKKARPNNLQQIGQQIDMFQGADLQWKNTLMQQQQQQQQQAAIARGIQYGNNNVVQKLSPQMFEGGLIQEGGVNVMPFTIGQQGPRSGLKEEPIETEQKMPQQFMRSGFPQPPWNTTNLAPSLENSSRKGKLVQSPRVSAGGLPQSPLSSKSGEFSSGSQFGPIVTSGQQKDNKSAATSILPVGFGGGNQAAQAAAAKRRSNSLPKIAPAISGVGSPANAGGNMAVPINANSPPVGNQTLADQMILERFSKIEMVTMRCQLNRKKCKVEEYPLKKPNKISSQEVQQQLLLANDSTNENKDETWSMPLSKSLVGGNMNMCKTRILNFLQTEQVIQGNGVQIVPKARTRMIMSEKPNDGAVAFSIGEIENSEYLAVEDYLPTLPNTYIADLLAPQFCTLMAREGYQMEDNVEARPPKPNQPSTQISPSPIPQTEMQQTGNNVPGNRMLPPGNSHSTQISQVGVPAQPSRPPQQQPEQIQSLMHQQQQQQNQNPQFQRSSMMNSMQHLNNIAQNTNLQQQQQQQQMVSHMDIKPSSLQLQMMQQQLQQRKMMAGLGTVGMGNINSNMVGVGVGGLGNNGMGIGGVRGNSAQMGGPIGNMNHNNQPMNPSQASTISNAIRSGTLTPEQATLIKMRMAQQSRSNLMRGPQSSIGNIPGARQMHPGGSPAGLNMLNSAALSRGGVMNQMQRNVMGAMGPPKLMSGMNNPYINQQQQQQQQQQQFQQIQQQMQMQMQQQQMQQENTSPLQAVVSPPQVGSPSSMGVMNQAQQMSPQQMSQRTPMSPQLSSGSMHQMSAGNQEACPASPQVSSQNMGSGGGGGVANSPMELQGGNKSNSVNNA